MKGYFPGKNKSSPPKVDPIKDMKEECKLQKKVRDFLSACAFFHIWIPYYAHISWLLKKW